MKHFRILAVLGAGLVIAGCGGGTGPTAGTLYVTYTTPNNDDGALLVKITGPAVTSVTVDTALKGYSRISTNGDTAVIVVAGTVHNGIVARLSVPDTRAFASYAASVLQVAQASTYAQRTLSGHSAAVSQ